MTFIIGVILGMYIGVLVMSVKFKKQLKQMKEVKESAPSPATAGSFSAESLVSSPKSEEE